MPGKSAILSIKILSDATKASKGLDDAEKSVGKFHGGMAKVGAVAAVAGGAVLAFGVSAAQAAAEDARGQAVLAQALKNSTGARDSDIKSVEDWISKTASATGVADDELRPALATLARATGDVTESQKAMRIALDVSAATGKDLGSVTDALAKGYAGNTASLGKLVPGLDKAALATKDMDKIMAELARTTGGSAAAAADTADGKMQRMKLAMDETKESIGAALLPALGALVGLLGTVADWAQNNSTVFLVLMGVVGVLAIGVGALSLAMKVHTAATTLLTSANWKLVASFLANPITWIVLGIVALIAVVVVIATKTKWFQQIWAVAFGAIKSAIAAVYDWIKNNWPLLLAILTGPIGVAVALIVKNWDSIKAAALAVYNWLKNTFNTIWDTIKDAAKTALDLVLAPIKAVESAFQKVLDIVKMVIDWIKKIKIPDLPGPLSKLTPWSASPVTFQTATGASAGQFATGSSTTTTTSSGPTIVIQGAIDPVATARQVRQILRDDDRRRGGVRIVGRPALP